MPGYYYLIGGSTALDMNDLPRYAKKTVIAFNGNDYGFFDWVHPDNIDDSIVRCEWERFNMRMLESALHIVTLAVNSR